LTCVTSRVAHTSVDCKDAFALASFWAKVLGYADLPGDPNKPGHAECMIVDPAGTHRLLFIEVPDAKQVKNRLHLDLRPTDRRRDEEIDRVLALGATPVTDLRNADGSGWLVLADPEGNEFCILRSDAEMSAAAG
jgi:Glyoxalase-like domain